MYIVTVGICLFSFGTISSTAQVLAVVQISAASTSDEGRRSSAQHHRVKPVKTKITKKEKVHSGVAMSLLETPAVGEKGNSNTKHSDLAVSKVGVASSFA